MDSHEKPAEKRCLIVDDNRDAAITLSQIVRLYGHETRVAFHGAAALAEAENFRPDVIFLDLRMPGIDGYEVCRRIRAEPWGKSILIVGITGLSEVEDRVQCVAAGFNEMFTKPVDMKVLKVILEICAMPARSEVPASRLAHANMLR